MQVAVGNVITVDSLQQAEQAEAEPELMETGLAAQQIQVVEVEDQEVEQVVQVVLE